MEKNRKSIVFLTLEDNDAAESVDEKTGEISMKAVSKSTDALESSCRQTHVEELPLAVRQGKEAIGTSDLSRLCEALCGPSDKLYDSDDSLISEIDYMDADELAAKSRQFVENIKKANDNKKTSRAIAAVLAMGRKKSPRKKKGEKAQKVEEKTVEEEEKPECSSKKRKNGENKNDDEEDVKKSKKVEFVEVDIIEPTVGETSSKCKKILPQKTTSRKAKDVQKGSLDLMTPTRNGNGTLDKWLTSKNFDRSVLRSVTDAADEMQKDRQNNEKEESEPTIIQFFKEGKSSKSVYLKRSEFVKVLEIVADLVEILEISDNCENADVEDVVKLIHCEHLQEKMSFYGMKTDFWTNDLPIPQYLLKYIYKMVRAKDLKDIFNRKKYGFKLTAKECILAIRSHYMAPIFERDNGKSVDPLDIDLNQLIKSCYAVKKSSDRDFEPNDLVKSVLMSTK